MARKFQFVDPIFGEDGGILGDTLSTVTIEYIRQRYWPYWSKRMKLNRIDDITMERCITDFMVVNWAVEVKDD